MRSILRRGIAPLLALIGIGAAGHAAGLPLIVYSAHTTQRIVALTFDDGPSSYTTSVLAVLRRWHMPATFFVIGSEVAAHPALVRAEVEAGYAIGNHTYTHADLLRLSGKALATQVDELPRSPDRPFPSAPAVPLAQQCRAVGQRHRAPVGGVPGY